MVLACKVFLVLTHHSSCVEVYDKVHGIIRGCSERFNQGVGCEASPGFGEGRLLVKLKISCDLKLLSLFDSVLCFAHTGQEDTKYPSIGNMGEKFRPTICQLSQILYCFHPKAWRSLLYFSFWNLSLISR